MTFNILANFPKEWLIDVEVARSGGRDDRGNLRPATTFTVKGCLLAPGNTSDPVDRSDVPDADATLYAPKGTVLHSTDLLKTPQGSFSVDGVPSDWPYGLVAKLRRANG